MKRKLLLLKTLTIALFLMTGIGSAWGQATLPFTFSGPWNSTTPTTGLTRSNTATYNSNGEAKLESTGHWIKVNFSGTPDKLSFWMKAYNAWGTNDNHVRVYEATSNLGNTEANWGTSIADFDNSFVTSTGINSGDIQLSSSSTWIAIFYTKVSQNVGIDDISISAGSSGPANPQSFTATTSSSSQINLSATANANSNNIVVVFNGTGTFTTPTDGIAPGNVGDALAGGTIHYKGVAGSLTNHTGLAANTPYYYKAFSYDALNYYSSGSTANATTAKIEPTNQPTSFTTGTLTTTTIPLTWTAAAAGSQSPDGYLLLLNTGTITDPEDGTDPDTGSLSISSGAASYKTSGTSATFTSAVAGTMYNIKIYSYTNSGSLINFNLTSPPSLSVAALPNPVTGASLSATGATTANISWSAASGYNSTNYSTLVFVKQGSAVTAGTPTNAPSAYTANTAFSSGTAYQNDDAAYCVYNADGTSVSITGLSANTTYHVLILTVVDATNSDATNSYSSGATANGTTSMAANTSYPWTEGFENGGTIPTGWSNVYVSGSVVWTYTNGGQSGNPSAAHTGLYNAKFYSSTKGVTTKLVSPPLDLTALSNPILTFWHTQALWDSDQDELRVYYKTSSGGSWTLIPGQEYTGSITSWQEEADIPLPNPSADYYIAFEGLSDYGYGVCIDDIEVKDDVLLGEPTNHANSFSALANGSYQINLTWSDNDGAQAAEGFLIVGKTGAGNYLVPADNTDPADDTDWTDNDFNVKVAHGTQAYSVTGLDAETEYSFKIYPYNNSGSDIDFKTDDTVPEQSSTTGLAPIDPGIGDLIITEICGTATNNGDGFMEIYNTTSNTILLDNVQARYWNSNPTAATPTTTLNLSGSIAPKSFIVIARNSGDFNTYFGFLPDFSNTDFFFNGGDDGCDIYLTTSTTILDDFNDNGTTASGHSAWTWDDNYVFERTNTGSGATLSNWSEYQEGEGTPKALLSVSFSGTTSNDWSTAGNWDKIIPGAYQNVTIPANKLAVVNSNNYECNNLIIAPLGQLTINSGKDLLANGAFLIQSDATGTGSFIENGTFIASSNTVQRYLTNYSQQTDIKYHFISSPVSAQAIRPNFVANTPADDVDFYKFDELTNYWINTKAGDGAWNSSFESNFVVGRGYMVAYPTIPETPKTFTGELNSYAAETPLTITCSYTADQGAGWNLIGNPFPSAIDWNGVAKGNGMDNALYYYDAAAQNYLYYIDLDGGPVGSGSQYIPAMQGFMVHAKSSGTKTVSIDNGDRVHEAQTVFYKAATAIPGSLSLKVSAGDYEDVAFVHFNEGATTQFDGAYDAYKLSSYNTLVPMIYTQSSNNEDLAINGLPELTEELVIPVYFVPGTEGIQTLTANLEGLTSAVVYLKDNKTNTTQNLTQNPTYSFTATEGDNPDRFLLHFGIVGIEDNTSNLNQINAYAYQNQLYVQSNLNKARVSLFDIQGHQLLSREINGAGSSRIPLDLPSGIYIVRLQSNNQVKNVKVFIN